MTHPHQQEPRHDDALSALLQSWPAPGPSAEFQSAVWQRIHTARARPQPQPLPWLATAAAILAILTGIWAALPPPPPAATAAHDPLLHPHTLAGSYLALTTGGTP